MVVIQLFRVPQIDCHKPPTAALTACSLPTGHLGHNHGCLCPPPTATNHFRELCTPVRFGSTV